MDLCFDGLGSHIGNLSRLSNGDKEWPTICGTGTEDYFGGAWRKFEMY
jgi:hypothetical protein